MLPTVPRSPLALAVLGLLAYRPLHPYGVQSLIKQWGKDEVINVSQRASLYKTFSRLQKAELIAVLQTERDQQYPERTVYELTEQGRVVLGEWMAETLSTPRDEFPEFPAALTFLPLLSPERTRELLGRRKAHLTARLREYETTLAAEPAPGTGRVPRVSMLETEYLRAVTAAEVDWIAQVIDGLRDGRITWNDEKIRQYASEDPFADS
jgi:DNA-binding PadR family transcriptional regulator